MASSFAFQPYGLSQRVTVVVATSTISLALVAVGGTTQAVTSGNYPVTGVRITNDGTVAAFVQFGPSTVTVGVNTGMEILASSVETFRISGMPFMAFVSTGTTTLGITPGEGI